MSILATAKANDMHPGEYPPDVDELVVLDDDMNWIMGWVFSREPLACELPSVDKAVNSLVRVAELEEP